MIVDGLLMLITGIVQWAYDLLPDWNIQEHFTNLILVDGRGYTPKTGYVESGSNRNPLEYVFSMLWQMNKYVPVDHVVAMLTLIGTFWGALLAYRVGKWLIGVVRGAGTQ